MGPEPWTTANVSGSVQFRVRVFGFILREHTSPLIPSSRYYGVIIPSILNLIAMTGFCILNCILGGQTLSSVSDGNLSWRYVEFQESILIRNEPYFNVSLLPV